jgi:hypothetical protein
MSDVEEKKSGYRLEYAKNNRAKCKGTFSSSHIIYHSSHRCTRLVTLQGRNLALVSGCFPRMN